MEEDAIDLYVGIDIGNTNTRVCFYNQRSAEYQLLQFEDGKTYIPMILIVVKYGHLLIKAVL